MTTAPRGCYPLGWARLGLALTAVLATAAGAHSEEAPKPPVPNTPALSTPGSPWPAIDEAFLLQMRKGMGDDAPVLQGASPEQQEQWFRDGLRRAAHQPSQPRQRRPSGSRGGDAAPTLPPPTLPVLAMPAQPPRPAEPWRRLLDAAGELGRIADRLEHDRLWDEAEAVRSAAAKLRLNARKLASSPDLGSLDPGPAE